MNKTREASPLSRRLKQTGKNRDTDSHMKPLKGSRFLWGGGTEDCSGVMEKCGQEKWLEVGAL